MLTILAALNGSFLFKINLILCKFLLPLKIMLGDYLADKGSSIRLDNDPDVHHSMMQS